MMDCEKAQELISLLLDGELPAEDEKAVREHIGRCEECRAMYEAFAAVSGAMRAETAGVPAALHESIMNGVRAAKMQRSGLLVRLRPYAAAAACLVVVLGAALALTRGGMGLSASDNGMAADGMARQRSPGTAAVEPQDNEGPTANDAVQFTLSGSAAPEEESSESADADVYGGMEILSARLVRDGRETEIGDLDGLAELLGEQPAEYAEDAFTASKDAGWMLRLETAGGSRELWLSFDGESVYVTAEDGATYLAFGTASEFLEIE